MSYNKLGFMLANGDNDLYREGRLGAHHYLALHQELPYLISLSSNPLNSCYVRYYSTNILEENKINITRVVDRMEWIRDFIPGNELNLPWETWGVQMTPHEVAIKLNDLLGWLSTHHSHLRIHLPAFSPGDAEVFLRACKEIISPEYFHVVDAHCYGSAEEMKRQYELVHYIFPSMPICITEFNFGAGRHVQLEDYKNEISHFLLNLPPYIECALWFIWRWDRPDPGIGNSLNIEGSILEPYFTELLSYDAPHMGELKEIKKEEHAVNLYQQWVTEGGDGNRDKFMSHLRAIGKPDWNSPHKYGYIFDVDKIKELLKESLKELGE